MNTLVLYDSVFGNTEKIAQSIGAALGTDAAVCKVSDVKPEQLKGLTLLVVGSPTRAFRPTKDIQAFLKGLPGGALQGVPVAAFDTRINAEESNSGFLRLMVKLFGYAAQPIADGLKRKGGQPVGTPEGFFVLSTEGPLKDGELERAAAWARQLR